MINSKATIRGRCFIDYIITLFVFFIPICTIFGVLMFRVNSLFWKIFFSYNLFILMLFFFLFVFSLEKSERAKIEEVRQCPSVYYSNRKVISFLQSDNSNSVNVVFYKSNYEGIRGVGRLVFWNPAFFDKMILEKILETLSEEFFEKDQDAVIIQFEKNDINEKQLQKYCFVNQNREYCWL